MAFLSVSTGIHFFLTAEESRINTGGPYLCVCVSLQEKGSIWNSRLITVMLEDFLQEAELQFPIPKH